MEKLKRDKAEPLRDQDLETVTGGMRPIGKENRLFPPVTPEDSHPPERGDRLPGGNLFY